MEFDKNHGSFVYSLMRLKARCLAEHLGLVQAAEVIYDFKRTEEGSFFSNLSDQIDVMLVCLLNQNFNRKYSYKEYLEPIILKSFQEFHKTQNEGLEIALKMARDDLDDVFNNRLNFITSSSLVDFTVSTYSVFEKWMGKLYSKVIEHHPRSEKKKADLIKLIDKFGKEEDKTKKDNILNKIMKDCSSYVSSGEQIQYILLRLDDEYPRDVKEDDLLIRHYAARRNTIHNVGIHIRESLPPLQINGKEIRLEQGKAAYAEDFNSLIEHCEKLLDIYGAVQVNLKIFDINLWFETVQKSEEKPQ